MRLQLLKQTIKPCYLSQGEPRVQGHPRSLILVPIESACGFLLVRHSNVGPILHRFWDIAGFCAPDPTPIPPCFGSVPVGPDRPCWGQPE